MRLALAARFNQALTLCCAFGSCVTNCCIFRRTFFSARCVVRFLTSWKYLKNKAASFVALSSGKVKTAVHDFGQQRPVETGAPNNKCTALKYTK